MTRTKHRKTHKQALAHWKSIHAPEPAPEGTPIQVAKKVHQVRYPEGERPTKVATVTIVTPEGITAELEGGGIITLSGASGGALQKGDRFRIDYPFGKVYRSGDNIRVEGLPKPSGPIEEAFFKAGQGGGASQGAVVRNYLAQAANAPLRGKSQLITKIDDDALYGFGLQQQAETLGRRAGMSEHLMVDEHVDHGFKGADYSDLEQRVLMHMVGPNGEDILQGFATPEEIAKIMEPSHPALSMGCVAEPQIPAPGRGLAEKVYGPGAQAHLEMAWHKDAEGKPVFDEISICPGPDPNGLTTL